MWTPRRFAHTACARMARFLIPIVTMAAVPAALAAQTIPLPLGNTSIAPQTPAAVPTAEASPQPLPSPLFSPRATPTPAVTPVPRATPSSRASATPPPRPSVTPTATATETPSPRPTASASPSPSVTPSPQGSAAPEAGIETVVLPHRAPADATPIVPIWAWFAGGALLLLALAALLLRRRGGSGEGHAEEEWAAAPAPAAGPSRLLIELRPTRAGINLISATVEAEVIVTNRGGAPANNIRAAVALLSAGSSADAALDACAMRPVGTPAVPAFTLAPDEERRFRAVAVLPLDSVEALTVADRPMFVPLVAVTAQWSDGYATARRATRGFAVGIERVDSAKLAPLWLDVPPKTYDAVAARPHGDTRET